LPRAVERIASLGTPKRPWVTRRNGAEAQIGSSDRWIVTLVGGDGVELSARRPRERRDERLVQRLRTEADLDVLAPELSELMTSSDGTFRASRSRWGIARPGAHQGSERSGTAYRQCVTPVPPKHRGLLDQFRRLRRLSTSRRARPCGPGGLTPGEDAKCIGQVQPAGDIEPTPFTHRLAPFWLVRLESPEPHAVAREQYGQATETAWEWTERFAFCSGTPFWLVDNDGARIQVNPVFLLLAWELEEVSEHPSVNGEDPELKALLNRHGVLAEPFMGIAAKVKFYETLVFQGDRIAAYGRVAEHARTVNSPYRDAAEVGLCLEGSADGPLVLSRHG
jgi:hypothetical protein